MEFLKSITKTVRVSQKKSRKTSKTRKRSSSRSPPKSVSPKKSKIFEYVRKSASWSGENQKPNEEKALSILNRENFDVNKTHSGETLLVVAYFSKNMKIFNVILDHPSIDLNEVTIKETIVDIVHKANAMNEIKVLRVLKSKGIFKRGYLPSELRKLANDKI